MSGFEVEFDTTKIIVGGLMIPSVETVVGDLVKRYEVYTISEYIIEWGSENELARTGYNASITNTINRNTGKIVRYYQNLVTDSNEKKKKSV